MSYNRTSQLYRFSLLLLFSVGLMIVDHRTTLLQPLRAVVPVISIPFEFIPRLPELLSTVFERYYPDVNLQEKYQELKLKHTLVQAQLQRYESLVSENKRLSKLLSATSESSDEILLAKIIKTGIHPYRHRIAVNRGIESGVYIGQPAIAPEGVLGQVSDIGYGQSIITLIYDIRHGLPVQVQRNGLLTIAKGSGNPNEIKIPYLDTHADLRYGDVLVTSGMGGRFPMGYPVGTVTEIITDVKLPFMDVTAQTSTQIDYTKDVLLLWHSNKEGSQQSQNSGNGVDG